MPPLLGKSTHPGCSDFRSHLCVPVAELCREHGMSNASFYKWRAKYGGMDASLISQMKVIEDENRRLKRMYADLSMQADLLKEALGKK